jgi:TonB family protein
VKHSLVVGLAMLAFGQIGVSAGQGSETADSRLSDPAFIRVRDEALTAAKCADRTDPVGKSTPKARYPNELKGDPVSGSAITEGIILPDGSVAFVRVMRATQPEFGKAALQVLKQHRYKPGTCGGKPVPRFVTFSHTFPVR